MTKLFAVALLSASLAACGAKKADTTPKSAEQKSDATGGAAYGNAKAPAQPANPCAGTKPGY